MNAQEKERAEYEKRIIEEPKELETKAREKQKELIETAKKEGDAKIAEAKKTKNTISHYSWMLKVPEFINRNVVIRRKDNKCFEAQKGAYMTFVSDEYIKLITPKRIAAK